MMRANPDVCFEVEHFNTLASWESVIIQGRFEELTGEDAWAARRNDRGVLPAILDAMAGRPAAQEH